MLLSGQNTSASGAPRNPQGMGSINISDAYVLKDGLLFNGIPFLKPDPFQLADLHQLRGIHKLDFPNKPMNVIPIIDWSIINATYKGIIEVILQNNDSSIKDFHLDGYFFCSWVRISFPSFCSCSTILSILKGGL